MLSFLRRMRYSASDSPFRGTLLELTPKTHKDTKKTRQKQQGRAGIFLIAWSMMFSL